MTTPDLAIRQFTGPWVFLSNFYPATVRAGDDGLTYPTAEHAYQAQKTGNIAERLAILHCPTGRDAKTAGRKVTLIDDWDGVRKRVMSDVVMAKFWQNPDLASRLCATGDAPLSEGNWWHDQFWGDCNCGRPSCAQPGRNYLGHILAWVRLVLREDDD